MEDKMEGSASDQKWAYKSWAPFLVMTIIGAVILTVAIVLMVLAVALVAEYPQGGTIPDEVLGQYLGLLIGSIICYVGAAGLMGPGIPLMIVTIIRRNKARAKLGMKK